MCRNHLHLQFFKPHSWSIDPTVWSAKCLAFGIDIYWLSFLSSISIWGFKILQNDARKSALSEDSQASNNFNSILKVVTLQLRPFLKVLTLQLWPVNGALSLCLCSFLKSYSVFLFFFLVAKYFNTYKKFWNSIELLYVEFKLCYIWTLKQSAFRWM